MVSLDHVWLRYLPGFLRRRLAGRGGIQTAIGNTGWLLTDRGIRLAVGLLMSVWVARYLGPSQLGQYNFAMAFAAFFAVFATLGLDSVVVRDLVRLPDQAPEILGATFVLRIAGATSSILFTILAINCLRPQDETSHLLVVIFAVGNLFLAFDAIDFWFQSRVQSRHVVVARMSAFLVISVGRALLILGGSGITGFAVATALEAAVAGGLLVVAHRRQGLKLIDWQPTRRVVFALLRETWPLALSSFAVTVSLRIDQVLLGELVGDRVVGLYGAATRFTELFNFFPMALISSLAPGLIAAKQANQALYQRRVRQLLGVFAWSGMVFAMVLSLSADWLMLLLYGKAFREAAPIMALHVWAMPFVFMGIGQTQWLVTEGRTGFALLRTLLLAGLTVLLNLLFIPQWGMMGAAAATLIAQACVALLAAFPAHQTRPLFFLSLRALVPIPRSFR